MSKQFLPAKMSAEEEEEEVEIESQTTEEPKLNVASRSAKCDQSCLHHGDRICYGDDATKEIIKKIPKDSSLSSSISPESSSLHSGESLFKSFSFEAHDDDPDMEKCMAFWKTILAKNAKPIKATMLKSKKKKEKPVKQEPPAEKSCQEYAEGMWINVYKDLQKRKLDKIKLVEPSKLCQPCADLTDDAYEKNQDFLNIKNLNDWEPHSDPSRCKNNPATRIDLNAQVKRTLQVLKGGRISQDDLQKSSSRRSSSIKVNSEISKDDINVTARERSRVGDSDAIRPIARPIPSTIQKEKSDLKQDQQNIDTSRKSSIKEDQTGICTECGCNIEDCICADMKDVFEEAKKQKRGTCFPCECVDECVCGDHVEVVFTPPKPVANICSCGCRVEDCTCGKLTCCTCGCDVEDCTCNTLEVKECPCECGVPDCMCAQLFTKTCRCGHADCDCDMMQTLNAYLETLEPQFRSKRLVNEGSQTVDTSHVKLRPQPSRYCIICGHFNCHCNEK